VIRLEHGEPVRFGAPAEDVDGLGHKAVVRDPATGTLRVADVTEEGPGVLEHVVVHDAHADDPTTAFALSRLADPQTLHQTPIGVLRDVSRPVYDERMAEQLETAVERNGKGDLGALLAGHDTWTVAG
jgi:2-oxoglutarate ferredoxin oxidoreductase subunit beta